MGSDESQPTNAHIVEEHTESQPTNSPVLVTSAEIQPGVTYVLQVLTTDEINTTNYSTKSDNATARRTGIIMKNWKRVLETAPSVANLFLPRD